MHEALEGIKEELEMILNRLQEFIPDDRPFGISTGNWHFPNLSRPELVEEVQSIITFIDDYETDDLGDAESRIIDYIPRLSFLRTQAIPNIPGDPPHGISTFKFTMDGLRASLSVLKRDRREEATNELREFISKLRGMQAQLDELELDKDKVVEQITDIEHAHQAAYQLPADLKSLSEAQARIDNLVQRATQGHERLSNIGTRADEVDEQLQRYAKEGNEILERCRETYQAATSVRLAAAFDERSGTLAWSVRFWSAGLVAALATGLYFGPDQLRALSKTFESPDAPASVLVVNVVLAVLSIGAPVWFAWLATKQIGQRFRLAEDYGYKASIARAYEGFREEAARIDKDMEAKLLASALSRLDELPLRLVEAESHGSPWQELASSDVVKKAMKVVPGFAGQVKTLADKMTGTSASRREEPKAVPPAKPDDEQR